MARLLSEADDEQRGRSRTRTYTYPEGRACRQLTNGRIERLE